MIFSSNYVLLNGYKLGNIRIVTAVAVVAVVVVEPGPGRGES